MTDKKKIVCEYDADELQIVINALWETWNRMAHLLNTMGNLFDATVVSSSISLLMSKTQGLRESLTKKQEEYYDKQK